MAECDPDLAMVFHEDRVFAKLWLKIQIQTQSESNKNSFIFGF